MSDKVKIGVILLVTFLLSFFLTTAITDSVARSTGFYTEGEEASRSYDGEY